MIMAISMFYHPPNGLLTVIAGYESGHTSVSQLSSSKWQTLYISQSHTQPILSLDTLPSKDFYLTSSADAVIAKHPIPVLAANVIGTVESMPLKTLQTKHAGQQSLQIRNDGKILATAGWDSKVRVYSTKGMKELAVLKWHKEGCYSVAFADVEVEEQEGMKTEEEDGKQVVKRVQAMTVKDERIWKAKSTHWLVAGSKDGKVSLWDIF
jgi:ASTRA-associated protein 1